jgi:hypothetical protein
MLVLRCTKKLLVRLPEREPVADSNSSTWLGDWYANPVNIGRQRLILCMSEVTLLPVVVTARDLSSFYSRLVEGLGEVLRSLGVFDTLIHEEQARMAPVAFAPTNSRVVLGMMNDFAFLLQAGMEQGESLLDASPQLARTPCRVINSSPDRATLDLFRKRSPLTLVK